LRTKATAALYYCTGKRPRDYFFSNHTGIKGKRGKKKKTMRVVVDSREAALLRDLGEEGCEKEFLVLGDIVFSECPHELIVERKTWNDLWSSIQDGRYREQRSRLLGCGAAVLYIIEGSPQKLADDSVETCRRALLRLQLAYRIPVVYTASVQATIEWVRWFRQKDMTVFWKTCDAEEQRVESIQSRTDSKKSSIQNPKTMLLTFFRSISGVSYAVAKTMAEPFASLLDLLQRRDEFAAALPSMEYISPSGKTRKIGPKLAEKILGMLGDPETTTTPPLSVSVLENTNGVNF